MNPKSQIIPRERRGCDAHGEELPSVTPPGWRLQQRQREILKDRKVTSSVTAVLFLLSTLPKLIHNRPFNHASSEIGSWERCFFDYAACYLSCNNWRNDTTRGKSPELHFHVQIKFSSYIILHDWLYNLNMVFNECRTVYSFVGDFGQLFSGADAALVCMRAVVTGLFLHHIACRVCTVLLGDPVLTASSVKMRLCHPTQKYPFRNPNFCSFCLTLPESSSPSLLPNSFSFSVVFLSLFFQWN